MVKSKKAKNKKVKPADWVVRARELLAATNKRLTAKERREDEIEANEIISGLRRQVEEAARDGIDEVVLFNFYSDCPTLGKLCGAPKLVAEHCRKIGLRVKIGSGDGGEKYLVAKL